MSIQLETTLPDGSAGGLSDREVAFHEAGHAAVEFLLGGSSRGSIEDISIRTDAASGPRVKRFPEPHDVCTDGAATGDGAALRMFSSGGWFRHARRSAIRQALLALAGPAAQNRYTDPDHEYRTRDWLMAMAVDHLQRDDRANAGTDYDRAIRAARSFCRRDRQAEKIVGTIAVWADELVAHRRFYGVVGALADRLVSDLLVTGEVAHMVMAQAWGGETPMADLGHRWQQRLCDGLHVKVPAG